MFHQTAQEKISKDIATGIAIISFIFAVSVYIPVFGSFFSMFIPLPVLFYRLKLGRKIGAVIPAVSAIIMIFIIGSITIDIFFFFELLLIGFVVAEMMNKKISIEQVVLYTCGIVSFSSIAVLIFYSNFSGREISVLVSEYVAKYLKLTLVLYKEMGMPEENILMISNSFEKIQYVLIRIIPAMMIAFILFETWITLLMAKPILTRKRLFFPDFGSLNLWKVPEPLVWGVIGCGILLIMPDKAFKIIALNGLIILMTIYFFGGIAILSFYFEKKQFSLMLRFFLYSLILLQQVILVLVILLGFFDMWANFRKIENEK